MKLESVVSSPLKLKLNSAQDELILSVFERVPQFWNSVPLGTFRTEFRYSSEKQNQVPEL